jgi:anti-sigma regulatory factor (Ser/Thr protein kinase)
MTINIQSTNDYFKLYSILEKELSDIRIKIIIEKTFLEPFEILILTLFIIKQKQRNCIISVSAPENILKYLKAIKIVDFCASNFKEPNTIEFLDSFTAMPIRRVEESTMNDYIQKTQGYFATFCKDKDLGMLNLSLSELINNVYNHSFSSLGAYVFAQYYDKSNIIKIAVADLGIGIPMSVNTFKKTLGEKELTSKECIVWALKEDMTTKSIPRNQGKGLDNIKSFMRKNKCSWKLFSENVLMNGYPSSNNYEVNPISFFKGTVVQLNIKIDNLPQLEVQDELDWTNF